MLCVWVHVCEHACVLGRCSHVQIFAILWTTALQAPLSVGLSRQEYWSGLPCPPPGDLPDPGIQLHLLPLPLLHWHMGSLPSKLLLEEMSRGSKRSTFYMHTLFLCLMPPLWNVSEHHHSRRMERDCLEMSEDVMMSCFSLLPFHLLCWALCCPP